MFLVLDHVKFQKSPEQEMVEDKSRQYQAIQVEDLPEVEVYDDSSDQETEVSVSLASPLDQSKLEGNISRQCQVTDEEEFPETEVSEADCSSAHQDEQSQEDHSQESHFPEVQPLGVDTEAAGVTSDTG